MNWGRFNDLFEKWGQVVWPFCVGIILVGYSMYAYFEEYPRIEDLQHLSGSIIDYRISGPEDHKLTLRIWGADNPISSTNVYLYPLLKDKLKNDLLLEIWVDPKEYRNGGKLTIWQVRLEGKNIISLEESITGFKERSLWALYVGILFTAMGTILWLIRRSKDPSISQRLYQYALKTLYLIFIGLALWGLLHELI